MIKFEVVACVKYVKNANNIFSTTDTNRNVSQFFDTVVKSNFNLVKDSFVKDALDIIENQKGTISIVLEGSASALAKKSYNKTRRP